MSNLILKPDNSMWSPEPPKSAYKRRELGESFKLFFELTERNPPKGAGSYRLIIRRELMCKAVTGHKLDRDAAIQMESGEISFPCEMCGSLIGSGVFSSRPESGPSQPLVTLS